MLAKVRSVISPRGQPVPTKKANDELQQPQIGMVVDMADIHYIGGIIPVVIGGDKQQHPYCRPEFLYLSEDEIALSADQNIRPVLCPKYPTQMPVFAGYAEVINTGKSKENEDLAAAKLLSIVQQGYEAEKALDLSEKKNPISNGKSGNKLARRPSDDEMLTFSMSFSSDDGPVAPRVEAAYFAIFDGHAGSGAAILAANCLHEHVKSRMNEVLESVLHLGRKEQLLRASKRSSFYSLGEAASGDNCHGSCITSDSLVIGALEAAFVDMDNQIAEEKAFVKITGGCAAIVCLVLLGKIYVANAGDCRAIMVTSDKVYTLSNDFNPVYERRRLQQIAFKNNDIIAHHFSRLEYSRHLTSKDLNRKVLYRDWYMDGWAAKTVREPDLKPPLISTRTRKPRLLNTIGVCRGFGDHHLMTANDKVAIKPFLSPHPEVKPFDVRALDTMSDKEVVVMASDGLWDVLSNDEVAMIVRSALSQSDSSDFSKYTLIAQELVAAARGELLGQCKWKLASGGYASTDDITVFVIPLKYAINLPKNDDDDDDELLP